jgi:hypothetical protein
MISLITEKDEPGNEPRWVERTFRRTEGRDPIGMQTITIDRIMPVLMPGILALTRRARYFSFYCFLLKEYQDRRQTATNSALSQFIKAREFEYALAVQRCPNGCGSQSAGVVGKQTVGPIARRQVSAFERGESVESHLGGYGLYYRTPLRDMGLVAPVGTPLGESVTPVDVIIPGSPASAIADAFRAAISSTRYYRDYMHTIEPIPTDVIAELSERACLCRLSQFPDEQQILRDTLLTYAFPGPGVEGMVKQRRRSFALFLYLLESAPRITESDGAFRWGIWDSYLGSLQRGEHGTHIDVLAQWAALIAKEYMQEAFAGMWSEFCRRGLAEQPPDGFTSDELETFIRSRLVPGGSLLIPGGQSDDGVGIEYAGDMPTAEFGTRLVGAAQPLGLEQMRAWTATENTAMTSLALLLSLYERLPDQDAVPPAWTQIGSMDSRQHPGLLGLGRELRQHLDSSESVADTVSWLVRRYVLMAHENLAYSKLPEFTFRFRWEDGRLRFYNMDTGRFGLTDIRREAIARISQDLGYWERGNDGQEQEGGRPVLTGAGESLVEEALL